jgi:hypothetical protein
MAKRAQRRLAETDLYGPLREHLIAQGYTVRSEVRDCDIVATKDGDLVVVELKTSFSVALLVQAIQRQRLTDSVYVALPRRRWGRAWAGMRRLLRRLELGLILVSPGARTPRVEVVFHPLPYRRQKQARARRAVLREMAERSGDFNSGGCCRRKLATAYREQCIHIACCLERFGDLSPSQLRSLGTGPKTTSILYNNFYGWFDRLGRARYGLTPRGRVELGQYPDLAAQYRRLASEERPADPSVSEVQATSC